MKYPSFLRHFFVLLGGTAASQLILVAVTPFLTRLYSPQDFGVLATLTGVLSVLAILSSFRYAQALAFVDTEAERYNVLVLCNSITVCNVTLFAGLIWAFGERFLEQLELTIDPALLWLVPIGFLFVGAHNTFRLLHIGRRSFRIVAASEVSKTFATIVLQLLLVSFGAAGISVGYVVGFGVAVAVLMVPEIQTYLRFRDRDLVGVRSVAFRYRDFPIYSSWAGLINNFSQYLPHFLFPFYFGAAGTGLFLLAQRMTFAPVSLIVKTTADVLMPFAAEARREGRLDALVLKAISGLSAIAAIPCVLIVVVAPWIFPILFGEQWVDAGYLAQLLALAVFFNVVGNPLTRLFGVMELQRLGLAFNVILFLARAPAIIAGGLMGDIKVAVLFYSVVSAIVWAGLLLRFGQLLNLGVSRTLRALLMPSVLPISGFAPFFLLSYAEISKEALIASLIFGFVIVLLAGWLTIKQYGVIAIRSDLGR